MYTNEGHQRDQTNSPSDVRTKGIMRNAIAVECTVLFGRICKSLTILLLKGVVNCNYSVYVWKYEG